MSLTQTPDTPFSSAPVYRGHPVWGPTFGFLKDTLGTLERVGELGDSSPEAATLVQRVEVRIDPRRALVPEALVTLRPRDGLPGRLIWRTPAGVDDPPRSSTYTLDEGRRNGAGRGA